MIQKPDLSLYIHWPFCKAKCPYCDFNSHVANTINMDEWFKAYTKQLSYFLPHIQDQFIASIFFGGGTPSLMSEMLVRDLLNWLKDHLNMTPQTEITLEANPTSSETKKFESYRESGINRLSIGVQSFNDHDLAFLGREHNSNQAKQTLIQAKDIFDRFNFDLIYARPNQTQAAWLQELGEALSYAKGHMSLYQLTIEKGTPFFNAYRNHNFTLPDSDEAAKLYEETNKLMGSYGYRAYEISNYALPSHECKHNLQYWHYKPYLGVGPGAHSRILMDGAMHALVMHHRPDKWLASLDTDNHGIMQSTSLTLQDQLDELLTMHLRLIDGMPLMRLQLFGISNISEHLPHYLLDEGLIHCDENRLSITAEGRLVTNRIIHELSQALCPLITPAPHKY